MKNIFYMFLIILGTLNGSVLAQTIGLKLKTDSSLDNGYILFSPMGSKSTYLINKCGKQVKTWSSFYYPGLSVYLQPDGNLLRTGRANNLIFVAGGNGGIIEKIDWLNNVVWSYKISDSFKCQHHDIRQLPNGNILVIAWESKPNTVAINAGRNPKLVPKTLWSEQILEIKPMENDSAIIVWEWHLWDHLVQDFDPSKANYGSVAANPQLMDINYGASAGINDWIHLNSVDYNESLDQILLTVHNTSEIWIIDHSTNTAQAAAHSGGLSGKGGDFLYRWGNPIVYKNGIIENQKLFYPHDAVWIEKDKPFANQIMIFNNGNNRPDGLYSTVDIINQPVAGFGYTSTLPFGPLSFSWEYNKVGVNPFYAINISGAQQLKNGNVLICNGPIGQFFEVTNTGTKVWEYVNPVTAAGILKQGASPNQNQVFRCTFYPEDFEGFKGLTLSPSSIIEDLNPLSPTCTLNIVASATIKEQFNQSTIQLFPNPAKTMITIRANSSLESANLTIYNNLGQKVFFQQYNQLKNELNVPIENLFPGQYFVKIESKTINFSRNFIKSE